MPTIYVKKGVCENPVKDKVIIFTPESDDFQNMAYRAITDEQHLITSAPTGSGKTRPMWYAAAYHLKKGKSVAITTPIKALSNQKYKEFVNDFLPKFKESTGMDINIGLMTGDIIINPEADCIIMTTEILNESLNDFGSSTSKKDSHLRASFVDRLGCVVFDEAHYFNDEDRGVVWESCLVKLKHAIRVVLLSATFPNIEEYADWLANKARHDDVYVVIKETRIVPLSHYIFVNNEIHKIMDSGNVFSSDAVDNATKIYRNEQKKRLAKHKSSQNFNILNDAVKYLNENGLLQAIFFTFSKRNCEKFSGMITTNLNTHEESAEIDKIFNAYMHPHEKTYGNDPQFIKAKDVMRRGICFHHADVIPILKEIIEILFGKGLIKVLFATETFAVGLNMPTKTTCFVSIEKPTKRGRRILYPHEFNQMGGRAGRRGIDTRGYVIILPVYEMPSRESLLGMMKGNLQNITSQIKIDYSLVLKTILNSNTTFKEFFEGTMFSKKIASRITDCANGVDRVQEKLDELEKAISPEFKDDLINYYGICNSGVEFLGYTVRKNNKQLKKEAVLKKKLESIPDFEKKYDQIKEYLDCTKELKSLKSQKDSHEHQIETESERLMMILNDHGFVDLTDCSGINDVTKDNITPYGIIAAQINECNSLLLASMLMYDVNQDTDCMFYGLTPAELTALLSIFTLDIRPDQRVSVGDIVGTPNIKDRISKIKKLVDKFIATESYYKVSNEEFWDISCDYVDSVHGWISGEPFLACLNKVGYEDGMVGSGSFIKNLIRLNNVVRDLIALCKVCNNTKLLPVLEEIEPLLIRDEVTVKSLYI